MRQAIGDGVQASRFAKSRFNRGGTLFGTMPVDVFVGNLWPRPFERFTNPRLYGVSWV